MVAHLPTAATRRQSRLSIRIRLASVLWLPTVPEKSNPDLALDPVELGAAVSQTCRWQDEKNCLSANPLTEGSSTSIAPNSDTP